MRINKNTIILKYKTRKKCNFQYYIQLKNKLLIDISI